MQNIYLRSRMTQMLCCASLLAALLLAPSGNPAFAGVIFEDNFDGEPGTGDGGSGQSGINYGSFANWSITDGTVDLVANGDFASGPGILCQGGAGKCVDLDGSSGNAGTMTSIGILLAPGSYALRYALAGVDAGFGQSAAGVPNIVDVLVQSVGGAMALFTAQATLAQGDPYSQFGGTFQVNTQSTVEIVFQNQGGDNFGAMLDDVALLSVPLPSTAALFAAGLLVLLRRPA